VIEACLEIRVDRVILGLQVALESQVLLV